MGFWQTSAQSRDLVNLIGAVEHVCFSGQHKDPVDTEEHGPDSGTGVCL